MNNIETTSEKLIKLYNECKDCKDSKINVKHVYDFIDKVTLAICYDFVFKDIIVEDVEKLLQDIHKLIIKILNNSAESKNLADEFIEGIPAIRKIVMTTASSIFDNDPAANSIEEIVKSYPGFLAIMYYRISHAIYLKGFKQISRIISEKAHRLTGIDINPGATIGEYFFLDHGTGIVIGETTIIGKNVKIYQGVTLGAISLSKGKKLKNTKRHPTIGDNVTIYANASILGGDTVIGNNCVIGSNVFITKSIPDNSLVTFNDIGIKIVDRTK